MEPVIVVGAGPVGLAAALALTRYAVPVVVLDETGGQEEPRLARTVVLRPDTAAFAARLGCAEVLESAGARWSAWRTMRRRRLLERVAFTGGEPEGGSGGADREGPAAPAPPAHLPQHALTAALRAALAREPLAQVATGSRLAAIDQDAAGVTAQTRGPNGARWRGSYLIGCDGPRSTVRKLLDIRFPGRTAVERHAVAALRTELPWPGEALLHRSPARHGGGRVSEVSARPLPGGVWRLDWLLPPGRDLVTPDALVARIRDSLAGWAAEADVPGLGPGIGSGSGDDGGGAGGRAHAGLVPPYDLLDTGVHTVHHRLARTWRRGRAFLAGDAAHLLGALGTQGLDEGLRDAGNLAWKLALAWHQGATETLLDSYQAERRTAVAARLRAADSALPLLRDGGAVRWRTVLPGAARGRSTLLTDGHLGRGPLGAAPSYPRTPLAAPAGLPGETAVGTAPGAPVADVPVTASDGASVGLRDRLGRGLLVVLVAPGTGVWDRRHWQSAGLMPRLTEAVAALPMPAEVLVTEAYPGAAAHTVLVVRPDGHLVAALTGVRPDQLTACAEAVRGGTAEAAGLAGGASGPADGVPGPAGAAAGADGGADGAHGGAAEAAAGGVRPAAGPAPGAPLALPHPVDPPGSSVLHSESD
ncbi:monooxygenase [Streptomyces sp. NRRL F-4489]|uniref:FAD-dependent monooxygenase n=1 Tax=Streptomyces sp. NRRL F-4489 TaxID=1609095 RepID=UPI00074640FB|nr:FAD-dependent monooxygenase [Streptomyces sp. NRRL F-4489]KUL52376.1 monooxygenase [Streptomyces sp. NRRL F-4489]